MSGEEIHAWSLLGMNGSTVSSSGYQLPPWEQGMWWEGRVESLPQDDRINNQV